MRRASLVVVLAACTSGGGGHGASSSPGEASQYADDVAFRRAELEASLVNPSNAYSALRLAHYAGGDGRWDALPEWNPRVDPVLASEVDDGTAARTTLTPAASALAVDEISIEDDAAMLTLGAAAFGRYPTQLAPYAAVALVSRAAASKYGAWVDDAIGVNGLVRAELADGSAALALTCASCHSRGDGGAVVLGVGSGTLDLGAIMADMAPPAPPASPLRAWGPGRVDVTTADGSAPVRIPDLRPTRWLTYLHHDATLAVRDRTALAIRIETLIVTSHDQALRPPRIVAWALATYLASLADALVSTPAPSSTHGAALFATECAACHQAPGFTGPPIALGVVGTDPAIGLSTDRGTGMYRVPSLRGVGSRPLLLHDASLPNLDAMFDPSRTSATFSGGTRGVGAVPGHPWGLELADSDRADLIDYVRGL